MTIWVPEKIKSEAEVITTKVIERYNKEGRFYSRFFEDSNKAFYVKVNRLVQKENTDVVSYVLTLLENPLKQQLRDTIGKSGYNPRGPAIELKKVTRSLVIQYVRNFLEFHEINPSITLPEFYRRVYRKLSNLASKENKDVILYISSFLDNDLRSQFTSVIEEVDSTKIQEKQHENEGNEKIIVKRIRKTKEDDKREMQDIIAKLDHYPTATEMKQINPYLLGHIGHKYGWSNFRKEMGYKPPRKPKEYWNKENTKKELHDEVEIFKRKHKRLPDQPDFIKLRKYGLLAAIHKHGGWAKLYLELGYEPERYPGDYFFNIENVNRVFHSKFERFIKENDRLPTVHEAMDFGLHDRVISYHSGYKTLLKKMGFIPIGSEEDLLEFVSEQKEAGKVLSLGLADDRYLSDAIDVLAKLFPERIDPKRTMELVDQSIISLHEYLGNFTITREYAGLAPQFLESFPETLFKVEEFENLLFNITRDSYMKDFNRDPKRVLDTLKRQMVDIKNPFVKKLLRNVLRYYREVLTYEIPGIASLEVTF